MCSGLLNSGCGLVHLSSTFFFSSSVRCLGVPVLDSPVSFLAFALSLASTCGRPGGLTPFGALVGEAVVRLKNPPLVVRGPLVVLLKNPHLVARGPCDRVVLGLPKNPPPVLRVPWRIPVPTCLPVPVCLPNPSTPTTILKDILRSLHMYALFKFFHQVRKALVGVI